MIDIAYPGFSGYNHTMLIISFDAVGDGEFDRMATYPAFAEFIAESAA